MCSATIDARSAFHGAAVGVLAFVAADGTPRACAVTPYVVDDDVLVTSTLAFLAKAEALHHDPRAAILAGGVEVRGAVTLDIDLTAATFDRVVRAQELAKFPPARPLLRLPGHRRLLWWYVGRTFARLPLESNHAEPGVDRVTVTSLEDGVPRIRPRPPNLDVDGTAIDVGVDVADGPAVVLIHDEEPSMADLRQLTLAGIVRDGVLTPTRRRGSLAPTPTGALDQLRELRGLARVAKARRPDAARLAAALQAT